MGCQTIADCGLRIGNLQIGLLNFEMPRIRNQRLLAIRNPQSAIRNPQSAIRNPQFEFPFDSLPTLVLACCFDSSSRSLNCFGCPESSGRIGKRVRFPHGPATVTSLEAAD
jgi:hypothetical protein